MHITKQQFQPCNTAGIDLIIARFAGKQDFRYRALSAKITASLHHRNTDFDQEVLETFYSRLFPVTYRDWL